MKLVKKISVFFLFMFLIIDAKAQDNHFSQFYNTPVLLNPALTGFFKQDYRAMVGYRNQWRQANATFATKVFAGDVNIPVNPNGDKVGVGIFFLNDQMGNKAMVNNSFFVSGSYIKPLDVLKRHRVSVGIQGGYVQKKLDEERLYFHNQIENYQVDKTLPSGEPIGNEAFGYFQVNVGAFYKYRVAPNSDFHTGISFFNANRPKENFVDINDVNQLSNRYAWQTGLRYEVRDNIFIHPEVLFMFQSKAIDFNVGTMVEYEIEKYGLTPQLGAWFRTRDAVIFMAGMIYKNFQLGFTYDMTVSTLNDVKDSPTVKDNARINALEFTLIYVGFFKRPLPYEYTVPCRFF